MTTESKGKKRLLTAASAFAIALGTGFVMQNFSPVADHLTGSEDEEVVAGSAGSALAVQPLSVAPQRNEPPKPQEIATAPLAATDEAETPKADTMIEATRAPAELPMPATVELAALSGAPKADGPMTDAPASRSEPAPMATAAPVADAPSGTASAAPADTAPDCTVKLNAKARPAAMVALSFTAPCHAGEPVTLRHGPLTFTEVTDADGALNIELPALSAKASFQARLDTGERAMAMTLVDGLDGFERTALMWQDRSGVGLHAFENGAGYGSEGHVSAAGPATPARGAASEGGYLTRLGNADMPGAWQAEVYSYPTAAAGTVQVNVEAEVTATNCGRDLSATVLTRGADGFEPQTLTAAMPACDAVGEFLVFSGILPDIRLAAN